jgi:hypothetical protein
MQSTEVLIGMAGLLVAVLTFTALYRWWQRNRVRQVENWVKEFLLARYGVAPGHLSINCSDDPLWPVLVACDGPRPGTRHRLQFSCPGPSPNWFLLSETEEAWQGQF